VWEMRKNAKEKRRSRKKFPFFPEGRGLSPQPVKIGSTNRNPNIGNPVITTNVKASQ
jgi:hypothetical protein